MNKTFWIITAIIIIGTLIYAFYPIYKWYQRTTTEDWPVVEQLIKDSESSVSGYDVDDALPQEDEVDTLNGDMASSTLETTEQIKDARITAYSKFDEGVTCISASQKNICWVDYRVIACPPQYPFKTKFRINDKEYICLDRMSLYNQERNYWDIWFDDDLNSAIQYGIQYHDIQVIY